MKNKSIRFEEDQLTELQRVAGEREMTFGSLVRHACEMFLLKEGLAVELDSMEERMAASMNRLSKEVSRTQDDVQLLIALSDQLTRFVLTATPEVIDKDAAAAVGNRRHAAYMKELHKAFSVRRRTSRLADELDSMGKDGD